MIDYRMETFLTLCDLMNYRQVAERLNITQPAVTQHIQFLEGEYRCKLFDYSGRQLRQTAEGKKLERYARSALSNEQILRQSLQPQARQKLYVGATKSIGGYMLGERLMKLMGNKQFDVSVTVDNTKNLLYALDHQQLNIALIEGYFDKASYGHQLMGQEQLVGICAKDSPLAGQEISMEQLFQEQIILRELGSGTLDIFLTGLRQQNYTLASFSNVAHISSIEAILYLVERGMGVSFVYQSVMKHNPQLATFAISGLILEHEFNYVYLKDTGGKQLITYMEGDSHSMLV